MMCAGLNKGENVLFALSSGNVLFCAVDGLEQEIVPQFIVQKYGYGDGQRQ